MYTPKRSHPSSGSRPRPTYLAVLLVVIGLFAAMTAAPALAMPKDPIDPPPIGGGGEEEPFVPPANGFDWSVPARFGLDVAPRDGMIDYHWRDSNNPDPAKKNTYDPTHIYPNGWPMVLDGCRSGTEEASGTSSNVYVWHIHGLGALASYSYVSPTDDNRCRFQRSLPAQGNYTVQLTILDGTTGEQIWPNDGRAAYEQGTYIKDYLIVSIGDSFASGEGNPDIPNQAYPPTTVKWQDARCHRSAIAGPAQAALQIERNDPHTSVTFISFACSGATVGNPLYDPFMLQWVPPFINLDPDASKPRGTGILGRYRGQEVPDGFPYPANNDAVNSFDQYLPSQIAQLTTALTPPGSESPRTPDALIMSGGGNDVYFADIAQACLLTWDCFENSRMHLGPNDGGYLINELVKRALGNSSYSPPNNLADSFYHLSQAFNNLTVNGVNVKPLHIYVTEYPDMGRDDNGKSCRMLDDIWWPNPIWVMEDFETTDAMDVLKGLNSRVKYDADQYGWTYVDGMMAYLDAPTTPVPFVRGSDGKGHGYCATDNWIRRAEEAVDMQGPALRFQTKGTLHPAAQAHQVYRDRILHYMAPDLALQLPANPPQFQTSLTAGTLTSFAGANGWFIKSCTGANGTGTCEDKVVLKVTANADPAGTATLSGATATVNGAAGCPAGAVCTGPELSNGNKTATWTYALAADGIYHFSFTAQDSTGQTASFAHQIKADLHDPQLTAPAPLTVQEGGSVALQAQASDAGGGLVDVDWDLNNDGVYEITDEQATFSAAALDGPAEQTIGVRGKDVAGRVAAATTTVSVLNVAPTAEIVLPSDLKEGSEIAFGSAVVDPGYNEQLAYAWQVLRDGVELATADVRDFAFTPADNGSYTVNLTVTDDDGGTGTAGQTFDVANVAPAASISSAPAANDEGTPIELTAGASDPSSTDSSAGFTYAWTVTKGATAFATGTGEKISFTPDDNGSYTVSVEAKDKDGGAGTASQAITVANVAPSLSKLALDAATLEEGGSVTLTGDISDPGSADSFSLEINWGDGSPAQTVAKPAGSSSFSVAHTYADDNPTGTASDANTVSVTLSDDDGASDGQSTTVTVNNAKPVVTITGPAENTLFPVTAPVNFSAAFTDAGADDTWTCQIAWDDGTTSAGAVSAGTCSASKTYAAAGIYSIQATVADDDTGSDTKTVMIVVYDSSAGFVTGAGRIDSPAGAYSADPGLTGPARFAFVSKYQKGARVPSGQTQFEFKVADFKFDATAYDWLVVAGAKAQYKGTGTVNGAGSYSFLLTVTDGQVNGGGGVDKFRIKIWDAGGVVYDNRRGVSDDVDAANPQAIAAGSIVIHQ